MKRSSAPSRLLLLLFALTLSACARQAYVSVPMGREELGLRMVEENGLRYLALARPACVGQVEVSVWDPTRPAPGHLRFTGVFPRPGTEERCFEAGQVPLPLLGNRRRTLPHNGSAPVLLDPERRMWRLELYVASDLPVDAHRLAEALNVASAMDDDLAVALWEGELARAGRMIEGLIADQPGSPLWAGLLRDRAR